MTSKSTKKDYKALYDALKTEHNFVLKKSSDALKDALNRLKAKDAEIVKVKAQLAKYEEAEKAYKTKFSLEETRLTSQEMKETERRAREDEDESEDDSESDSDFQECGICSAYTDQICANCATCDVPMCDSCGHFHKSDAEGDEESHPWYCPEHFDGRRDVRGLLNSKLIKAKPSGMFARLYKNKNMSLEDFDYYKEFMNSKDRKCLLKDYEGQDESDLCIDLELIQLYVKSESRQVSRYVLLMVFDEKYTICTYVNTNSCLDVSVSNNYFEDDCHKGEGDDEGDEEVIVSIENLLTHIPANCHKGVRKIWEENI